MADLCGMGVETHIYLGVGGTQERAGSSRDGDQREDNEMKARRKESLRKLGVDNHI